MLDTVGKHIFVFGSNLAGRHGAGAALHARLHYGAEYGVGRGRTGRSYAIPTKDEHMRTRSLDRIKRDVEVFVQYAANNPHLVFHVTRVGCGLAGYKDEDIAPMFVDAPPNCKLPPEWEEFRERSLLSKGEQPVPDDETSGN